MKFYSFTEKSHKSEKMYNALGGVYIREARTTRWEKLFYGFKMLLEDILGFCIDGQ